MSITIGEYQFQGPYTSSRELRNESGVYAVLGRNRTCENWTLIDIGESDDIRQRIDSANRTPSVQSNEFNMYGIAVFYIEKESRMILEREVRKKTKIPCYI